MQCRILHIIGSIRSDDPIRNFGSAQSDRIGLIRTDPVPNAGDVGVLQEKFERVVGLTCRRNVYAAVEGGNKNMVDGRWGNVFEAFAISRGQL